MIFKHDLQSFRTILALTIHTRKGHLRFKTNKLRIYVSKRAPHEHQHQSGFRQAIATNQRAALSTQGASPVHR